MYKTRYEGGGGLVLLQLDSWALDSFSTIRCPGISLESILSLTAYAIAPTASPFLLGPVQSNLHHQNEERGNRLSLAIN